MNLNLDSLSLPLRQSIYIYYIYIYICMYCVYIYILSGRLARCCTCYTTTASAQQTCPPPRRICAGRMRGGLPAPSSPTPWRGPESSRRCVLLFEFLVGLACFCKIPHFDKPNPGESFFFSSPSATRRMVGVRWFPIN